MSDLHGLQVAFTPELIEAMERLIDERVQVALETHTMNAKRWLTPREAGELLACSERAVYERVRKGRIPASREALRPAHLHRPEGARPSGRTIPLSARASTLGLREENGPATADTARGPDTGGNPMSISVYGPTTRRQVVYRGEKVAGLFERTTSDGRVVYELRRKVGGRSVRRALEATTATDAIREARSVVAKIDGGERLIGNRDASLGDLRDEFEEWGRSANSTLAQSTLDLYLHRLDAHVLPDLGRGTKVATLTAAHLRAMIERLQKRGVKGSSARGCVIACSRLLKFAVHRGVIARNPARDLEPGDRPSSKRQSEPRYLDAAQIASLLAELGKEFRPIAATMAYGALRVSEALALTWSHVDLTAGMIQVPGTKSAASSAPVPIIPLLAVELRAHRAREAERGFERVKADALVFQTRTGRAQDRRDVLRAVYGAGDAAGLNPEGVERVGCHDLRHSAAGLLLAAGAVDAEGRSHPPALEPARDRGRVCGARRV